MVVVTFPLNIKMLRFMHIIASLFTSTAYLPCDCFTLGSFILPLMSICVFSRCFAMKNCDHLNVLVYISFSTCSKISFKYTLREKLLGLTMYKWSNLGNITKVLSKMIASIYCINPNMSSPILGFVRFLNVLDS